MNMSDIPPKIPMPQIPYKLWRVLALIAAIPLSGFALMVFLTVFFTGKRTNFSFLGSGMILGPATVAFLCLWFALRGEYKRSRARMLYALMCALIVGGISFLVGFVGPMIIYPQSNQGPLFGIFITGPLGFVAGAVIGTIVGFIRTREISN
jgi:hypothetical protein